MYSAPCYKSNACLLAGKADNLLKCCKISWISSFWGTVFSVSTSNNWFFFSFELSIFRYLLMGCVSGFRTCRPREFGLNKQCCDASVYSSDYRRIPWFFSLILFLLKSICIYPVFRFRAVSFVGFDCLCGQGKSGSLMISTPLTWFYEFRLQTCCFHFLKTLADMFG